MELDEPAPAAFRSWRVGVLGMDETYTPEAIAGREKKRTSEDRRRLGLAAVAIGAVVSICVFALGIAIMSGEGETPPSPQAELGL